MVFAAAAVRRVWLRFGINLLRELPCSLFVDLLARARRRFGICGRVGRREGDLWGVFLRAGFF